MKALFVITYFCLKCSLKKIPSQLSIKIIYSHVIFVVIAIILLPVLSTTKWTAETSMSTMIGTDDRKKGFRVLFGKRVGGGGILL